MLKQYFLSLMLLLYWVFLQNLCSGCFASGLSSGCFVSGNKDKLQIAPLPFGCSWWLSWQRIHLQGRRPGCDPWVGKIPWRGEWLPTPIFWPGEFHGRYSPCIVHVQSMYRVAKSRTRLRSFHFTSLPQPALSGAAFTITHDRGPHYSPGPPCTQESQGSFSNIVSVSQGNNIL